VPRSPPPVDADIPAPIIELIDEIDPEASAFGGNPCHDNEAS
jgi:hypothetical protein